jgi:putative transposase
MPNHIHGIIGIVGVPLVGTRKTVGDLPKRADTRPAPTAGLGDIIGAFKSITMHEYIRSVKQHGWSPFPGKLWQRNYYEHVVRNEKELTRIREYIRNNPAQWDTDKDNPFTQAFGNHSDTIKEQ